MYDDLISSMRICRRMNSANDNCIAFHDGSCEAEPVCMYELMDKAADAIEKLEKQLYAEKEVCDGYYYAYQHWMHQYIKDIGDRDAGVIKTCVDCQRDCQMIGLNMPACTAYKPPKGDT